jgi:hypothetical protein
MSERTRKQKDSELSAKEEQTYETRNEGGIAGSKVADIRYPDAGANLARNPGTGEPTVSPTAQGSDSKGSKDEFENVFVDVPGSSGNASSGESDARRDASPDQRANLLKQVRSQDTQ